MNAVEQYIGKFPPEIQERLLALRKIVQEEAPNTTERICMNMPTYDLNGKWFFHFASFKNHIGVYPQPSGIVAFEDPLKAYKTAKGSIRFPHAEPLPVDLIREIVKYRYQESMGE